MKTMKTHLKDKDQWFQPDIIYLHEGKQGENFKDWYCESRRSYDLVEVEDMEGYDLLTALMTTGIRDGQKFLGAAEPLFQTRSLSSQNKCCTKRTLARIEKRRDDSKISVTIYSKPNKRPSKTMYQIDKEVRKWNKAVLNDQNKPSDKNSEKY